MHASPDCNPYTSLFVFPDTAVHVCGSGTRQDLGDAQCRYPAWCDGTGLRYASAWGDLISGVQSSCAVRLRHTGVQNVAPAGQLQRVFLHRRIFDVYTDPVGLLLPRLLVVPATPCEDLVLGHSSPLWPLLGPDLPVLAQSLRCVRQSIRNWRQKRLFFPTA